MTVWDVVNSIIGTLPSVAARLLLIAVLVAVGIFIAGFHKYGLDFIKHGSKQKETAGLDEKIDGIAVQLEDFRTELQTIKVNHFGHLTDYLAALTSILLDKDILNHQDKARLDNNLRGM
jgi:hypothetical protein